LDGYATIALTSFGPALRWRSPWFRVRWWTTLERLSLIVLSL